MNSSPLVSFLVSYLSVQRLSCVLFFISLSCSQAEAHQGLIRQKTELFVNYNIIQDQEVQMVLSIPKSFIQDLLKDPINFNQVSSPQVQRRTRDQLSEYLTTHHSIFVDHVRVQPLITELDLVLRVPKDQLKDPALKVDGILLHSRPVGAIIVSVRYPLKSPPKEIRLQWMSPHLYVTRAVEDSTKLLDQQTQKQKSHKEISGLISEQDQLVQLTFTPQEPEYIWHSIPKIKPPELSILQTTPLPKPALPITAVLCILVTITILMRSSGVKRAGVGVIGATLCLYLWSHPILQVTSPWKSTTITDSYARDIFEALHHNIYRAFDYEREEEIYDVLAQSVSGELLDWVFQKIYRGLILRDEGGARSKVTLVRPLKWTREPWDEVDSQQGFAARYRWRVVGEVRHWGHQHKRVNEYEALYEVIHNTQGWRIRQMKIIDHARRPKLEGQ